MTKLEWDRYRSDLGCETQTCEENAGAELPAVPQNVEVSVLAVMDWHWHPGRLLPCYKAGFDGFFTLHIRHVEVPVILTGGCAVYGLAEIPKSVTDSGWVICKGSHPKQATNASKVDVG